MSFQTFFILPNIKEAILKTVGNWINSDAASEKKKKNHGPCSLKVWCVINVMLIQIKYFPNNTFCNI